MLVTDTIGLLHGVVWGRACGQRELSAQCSSQCSYRGKVIQQHGTAVYAVTCQVRITSLILSPSPDFLIDPSAKEKIHQIYCVSCSLELLRQSKILTVPALEGLFMLL
jgi:hypothetical protein